MIYFACGNAPRRTNDWPQFDVLEGLILLFTLSLNEIYRTLIIKSNERSEDSCIGLAKKFSGKSLIICIKVSNN